MCVCVCYAYIVICWASRVLNFDPILSKVYDIRNLVLLNRYVHHDVFRKDLQQELFIYSAKYILVFRHQSYIHILCIGYKNKVLIVLV